MPPKVRITKEDIVRAAVDIVRKQGAGALNARTVAATLGCSTQPVFSNFTTMEALQKAAVEAAYEEYLGFLQRESESGNYPKYKSFGMGYVRFAGEEKELFKLLFMRDREGETLQPTADWEAAVAAIMEANGFPREKAELLHMELWVCVHGIATMLATSYTTLSWELISRMLTDIYQGVRARHKEEGI